ncbi:acetylornithine deacetylase [Natronomonas pharaonis DSM 2160]|uniref:Putative [LysW]-lysine/[LysW]-ornithine hydrolase n=1 Tax=Natronomonas pharaonis (strain ATCC 35678 / DSM 2160 / CIP 103997 / JCM 8858 / NBRC 14720 / NCIMB 2260 / Gabara) TaxID=348780 RepID=A0A1U7EZK3_NATPD|nr:[LysW]-lysine hydrolase [Natronomonas pharaonis]CAI50724.1 acetylornithine deacetylase [Natronomonas pharaonis DSM 2160]
MSESTPSPDEEARDLLETLVSIPSPTPEETECAEALAGFFESHGRDVFIDEVGNVRAPADDSVLYTSHIDTVPGDIPVRIEDGDGGPALWGRGSVDAKGPLTALAVAAVRTGVSFVGVVGEEVDSRGARHLVADREPPDAVVNGEPSGCDGITLGYRGILQGTYRARSASGHTSRPENNAIQDAVEWWSAVESRFEADDDTPVFERVTPKPVDIDGGVTDDGLAVETTLEAQLRVPPSMSTDAVRAAADEELETGTVTWNDAVEPTMQSPRTPVARAFRAAIRKQGGDPRLLRKTGTADMNIYAGEWDCPMVTYGPGDSDLDHAPDEHLPLAELDRSVAVLETVAEELA